MKVERRKKTFSALEALHMILDYPSDSEDENHLGDDNAVDAEANVINNADGNEENCDFKIHLELPESEKVDSDEEMDVTENNVNDVHEDLNENICGNSLSNDKIDDIAVLDTTTNACSSNTIESGDLIDQTVELKTYPKRKRTITTYADENEGIYEDDSELTVVDEDKYEPDTDKENCEPNDNAGSSGRKLRKGKKIVKRKKNDTGALKRKCPNNNPDDRVFRWKKKTPPKPVEDPGTQDDNFSLPPASLMSPMEYFSLFWDDTIMDTLVYQTNLYSVRASINLTKDELEEFLGIQMRMSVVKMPSYELYWAAGTSYDPIASVMSRDRYKKVRRFLHANDNSEKDKVGNKENRLYIVQPIITAVRQNGLKVEQERRQFSIFLVLLQLLRLDMINVSRKRWSGRLLLCFIVSRD